jgi:hypothetical protein
MKKAKRLNVLLSAWLDMLGAALLWTDLMAVRPAGWWLTNPSEKYDFVSWDDDIPN